MALAFGGACLEWRRLLVTTPLPEALKPLPSGRALQFLYGLGLDLSYAFSGETECIAYLLQRVVGLVV